MCADLIVIYPFEDGSRWQFRAGWYSHRLICYYVSVVACVLNSMANMVVHVKISWVVAESTTTKCESFAWRARGQPI